MNTGLKLVSELIGVGHEACDAMRRRISEVRWAKYGEEDGDIAFLFDGEPYVGKLLDRNADAVLSDRDDVNASLALKVLIDGCATRVKIKRGTR